MTKDDLVGILVDAVICGNKIDSSSDYAPTLKRITVLDIFNYLFARDYKISDLVWKSSPHGKIQAFDNKDKRLNKLEIFKKIKQAF